MFDLLKKRISGFVDKLGGKAGNNEEEIKAEKPAPKEEKTDSIKEIGEAEIVERPHGKEGEAAKPPKSREEKSKAPKKEAESLKPPKPGKGGKVEKKKKAKPAEVPKKPEEKKGEIGREEEAAGKKEASAVQKPGKDTAPRMQMPEGEEGKKGGDAPLNPDKAASGQKDADSVSMKKDAEKPKERKKGFLERVFGGGKKKEEAQPAPKAGETEKVEAAAAKEAKGVQAGSGKAEAPAKKEAAPAPPKEGVSERAQKKEEELKGKVKKGLLSSVTETIRGESEIKEEEIAELLDELELGMLESDVALSVAEEIKEELRKRIVGAKVKRGQTAPFVRNGLKDILIGMFRETPGFDIAEKLGEGDGPRKIMVVGPNGAGKTTTIAKIVNMLKNGGHSVCVAASDTFRAAAVEQLVHHGNKLGVKVIHGEYGSDPTSIAFDALNHAKANDIGIIVIDTAGRQDTNINLINQLKKMDRVIKPDLKIYVGESIAGNAMVEQISTFNNDIGLDGVVLTKLDCDPKGGTVISVSRVAKLPILYVGTGQGYGDLRKFNAEEIVEEILS